MSVLWFPSTLSNSQYQPLNFPYFYRTSGEILLFFLHSFNIEVHKIKTLNLGVELDEFWHVNALMKPSPRQATKFMVIKSSLIK